ncbi:hypothetical protein [Imhoffiella purpurea]|uniref:Uncharacterized protein n=1 Tax=Imhoffiella purpurea TaxID=1249627 RepID=W9VTK3_9GAMM|nr:hypothetical protein [Imhoffiella purpurea]EXJ13725.1 hypothetical protein D779_3480 [Imhoffiella purpurea]
MLNLCPKCNHSLWPFVVISLITILIGFLTWLMLGLSPLGPLARLGIASAMFLVVGGTLLHYVLSCLRRHCRHQHDATARRREVLG